MNVENLLIEEILYDEIKISFNNRKAANFNVFDNNEFIFRIHVSSLENGYSLEKREFYDDDPDSIRLNGCKEFEVKAGNLLLLDPMA